MIQVTKTKAVHEPTRWRAAQQDGLKILKYIGTNPEERRALLGDCFDRITSALSSEETNPPAVPSHVAMAGPGPSTLASAHGTSSNAVAPPGASRHRAAASTADPGPPAKRRKTAYEAQDVIDLTSD